MSPHHPVMIPVISECDLLISVYTWLQAGLVAVLTVFEELGLSEELVVTVTVISSVEQQLHLNAS